jgi:hypothetical protein
MGMFDTIIVRKKLPQPKDPKGYTGSDSFQTKDLENCLLVYEIRKDGTLWVEQRETKFVEGDKNAKTFSERMGYLETINSWFEPVKWNSEVVFYDFQQKNGEDQNFDYDIEYRAEFKNGKMTSVKLIKFEALDNTERKKAYKEMEEKMKKRYIFTGKWYFKYIFAYWNKAMKFCFRKLHKHSHKIGMFLYKIENALHI